MGDTFEYLVYVVDDERRKDKSRRCYDSLGNVCSKIDFVEACSSKIVISLRRFGILRIKIEDM